MSVRRLALGGFDSRPSQFLSSSWTWRACLLYWNCWWHYAPYHFLEQSCWHCSLRHTIHSVSKKVKKCSLDNQILSLGSLCWKWSCGSLTMGRCGVSRSFRDGRWGVSLSTQMLKSSVGRGRSTCVPQLSSLGKLWKDLVVNERKEMWQVLCSRMVSLSWCGWLL